MTSDHVSCHSCENLSRSNVQHVFNAVLKKSWGGRHTSSQNTTETGVTHKRKLKVSRFH